MIPRFCQYLVEPPIENVEVALGRRPVKQGPAALPVEQYLYRGEVVNNAIKMAGGEVNLFRDKAEVTHKMDFSDLSDEELVIRLRDEAEALPDTGWKGKRHRSQTIPNLTPVGHRLADWPVLTRCCLVLAQHGAK